MNQIENMAYAELERPTMIGNARKVIGAYFNFIN